MREDSSLYKELTDVPPIPHDAFKNIEGRIHHNNVSKKVLYSIAAMLLLTIGATSWITMKTNLTSSSLKPEIASELQTARDFLNGDDLENGDYDYVVYSTNEW